ncbi:sphinganine kinase lcb4 [Lecanora helva]
MARPSAAGSDPFADPSRLSADHEYAEASTLPVGRNASLTLATDSLITRISLEEGPAIAAVFCLQVDIPIKSEEARGVPNGLVGAKTTQAIPFFNVLWAELSDFDITIKYAKPASTNVVRVATINYLVEKAQQGYAKSWTSKLLDRAYGESQRQKRIKVLINPFGGQGSAQKWYLRDIEPIFAAARCEVEVERTLYQGHAVEIAEKLDTNAYDVIASCSGDGLPHEVFNGLGKKADAISALSKVAVVQLPCGTGNAMSWNLNGIDSTSMAALCTVKGIRTPLDLASVTQGDKRTLSFLSQSLGIVADVDLGTEHIRWMGSARFTYGFLIRFLKKAKYPCDLAVKIDIPTKGAIKDHYRRELTNRALIEDRRDKSIASNQAQGLPPLKYGTVSSALPQDFTPIPSTKLGNFYAGNMALMAPRANFFPATLPSDGHLDLVTVDGDISRIDAIKSFLAVENGGFFDKPHVNYKKISAYRITPHQSKGYISIDGESMPFEPFQAEVHRGLGTVLSRSGHLYEADGVVPRIG